MSFFLRRKAATATPPASDPPDAPGSPNDGQSPSASPPAAPATPSKPPSNPFDYPDFWSPRSRSQLTLFAGGATFVLLSALITRRSLVKRHRASTLAYFQPSNQPNPVNGAVEALDALSLATINVASFGIMLTGGLLWAFNVSTMEDARARFRMKGVGSKGVGGGQADKDFEEWLVAVLEKKSGGGGGGGGKDEKDVDRGGLAEIAREGMRLVEERRRREESEKQEREQEEARKR